ncbi:hypothetical protein [Aurantimonas sp. HBX-1]|uniref:hypothetical protein n=1 Tax=Aurantimonas sp. HBX-1 TaxID=2906072 RepID=UPI001F29F77F|nr:hypothetical protein [Aurantimonas sp. HBX-1]UIJ73391.1 hypothetical protein LXB15_07080 [Aurantimonas sp. HBX-1]
MNSQRDLQQVVERELDRLAPIVEHYGGLDPCAIIDMISDMLQLPGETVEAAITEAAANRGVTLVRVYR